MMTGILSALVLPFIFPAELQAAWGANPALPSLIRDFMTLPTALVCFPAILAVSVFGCFAGSLLTKPESDAVLKNFYTKTRPWGFWGPVLKKVQAEDPSFKPNPDFVRDMFNIVVGVIWQTALVAMPIYVVIREFDRAKIAAIVVGVTSLMLYIFWYRHLKTAYPDSEMAAAKASEAIAAE
jgi:hypothetical protein